MQGGLSVCKENCRLNLKGKVAVCRIAFPLGVGLFSIRDNLSEELLLNS